MPPVLETPSRILFVDRWRALMVALVVLDHAVHAYSPHYANMWFLPDTTRSLWADIFHLHNDSVMMPALFFMAGLFVTAAVERRGPVAFIRERAIRLGVPFAVGLPIVSPLLTYPAYAIEHGTIPYPRYLTTVWIHEPEVGPFWFLGYLALLNVGAVLVYLVRPSILPAAGRGIRWLVERPAAAFLLCGSLMALLLTISDQLWGAPWWIGYGRFLRVRASRFLVEGGMYFVGMAVAAAGLMADRQFLQRLGASWRQWTLASFAIGSVYVWYTLAHFDTGAYSDAARHFYTEATEAGLPWPQALAAAASLAREHTPGVAVRTSLLGFFLLAQIVASSAICVRFLNHPSAALASAARASFGVYLLHEPFVVWLHWALQGSGLPVMGKFAVAGSGSLIASYLLVSRVLLRLRAVQRVL
jgi:Acyltransferase family